MSCENKRLDKVQSGAGRGVKDIFFNMPVSARGLGFTIGRLKIEMMIPLALNLYDF